MHSCSAAVMPPPFKIENNDAMSNLTDHIFKVPDLHEPELFFQPFTPSNINYGKSCSNKKPCCALRVSDSHAEVSKRKLPRKATPSFVYV